MPGTISNSKGDSSVFEAAFARLPPFILSTVYSSKQQHPACSTGFRATSCHAGQVPRLLLLLLSRQWCCGIPSNAITAPLTVPLQRMSWHR